MAKQFQLLRNLLPVRIAGSVEVLLPIAFVRRVHPNKSTSGNCVAY